MNRKTFFDGVRMSAGLFAGTLSQNQVDGMSAILDEWDRRKLADTHWLAYMLATTFHETVRTMQPIREIAGARQRYAPYYGRGFVQLTWQANYLKASAKVGVDLVANPDKALEVPIAAKVLIDGMIDGWFTGHKLADYIAGRACDYVGARRIVNGTDRAVLIAGYAGGFQRALDAATTVEARAPAGPRYGGDQLVIPAAGAPPAAPKPPPKPLLSRARAPDDPGTETSKPARSSGFFDALARVFAAIVAAIFPKGT
jgi:hypothetical protein